MNLDPHDSTAPHRERHHRQRLHGPGTRREDQRLGGERGGCGGGAARACPCRAAPIEELRLEREAYEAPTATHVSFSDAVRAWREANGA